MPQMQSIPGQFYDPRFGQSTPSNNTKSSIPGQYNPVTNNYNAWPGGQVTSHPVTPGQSTKQNDTYTPVSSTSTQQSQPQSTYYDSGTGQSYENYDAYLKLVEDAYSGQESYLNDAESAVRGDYPSALAEAEAAFKTNVSSLDNSKKSAFNTLDQQQTKGTQATESALEAARRLFQEQQMGATQRFGGASSAGQAASEIQNREFARNYGQTKRQQADLTNQIETQRANIDREYQTGLLQLEQSKQTAIANANRDFQNKLLQISQNRALIGQAKAEARLGALQQLRSEVFAIEQQNQQFAQTIELQKQQAQLSLGNFSGTAGSAMSNVNSAVGRFNPQGSFTNNSNVTGGLGRQGTPQLMGSIRRDEEQQLAGAISPGYRNPNDPFRFGLS